MFNVDDFLSECVEASTAFEPRLALKEVLERAVRQPDQVAQQLPATRAEVVPLHVSDRLSVLKPRSTDELIGGEAAYPRERPPELGR